MLAEFTAWLVGLVKDALLAVFSLIVDVAIKVVDLLLGAVVALVAMIPVPEFLASGLQSLWSLLDSGILYLANAVGVPQALAFVGAAYAFRLVRKVVTLFQW